MRVLLAAAVVWLSAPACGEGRLDTAAPARDASGDVVAVGSDAAARPEDIVPLRPPDGGIQSRDMAATRPHDAAGTPDTRATADASEAPDPPPVADAAMPDAASSDVAPAPPRPLLVAILSDLNGSYGDPTYEPPVHAAVQRVLEVRPDVVLCAGDMVAGQQAGLDYRAMWRGFHAAVSEPLAEVGIPLAVSPGNHDASGYPGFEQERRIFGEEWSARRPAVEMVDEADYPFRYSFRMGDVLFVSLDDTLVGRLPRAERDWVAARLADPVPRSAAIVFGHVPIRAFTQGREDEILDDDALEDLFVERGVTLFVAGHHHGYFPGRHRGLRQLSMPCLGSGSRALVGTNGASPRGLVLLRLEGGSITELEAFTGAEMRARIERATLPERLGPVIRDDL